MARPSFKDCNLFFFDCETGGLDPRVADCVEVACIVTDATGRDIRGEYSAKVNPKLPVDPGAARVNGYNAEKWAAEGAIEMDEAMFRMLTLARDAVFVAHNAPFDWGFFQMAMSLRSQRWPGDYHRICTVALSVPLLQAGRVTNLKLNSIAEHFGVPHEGQHTAMGDVAACRGVYLKLSELYAPLFAAA